jgi:CRISPR-associated protein Csx17
MTLHLHHLTGCAPTPLAHYLKALGVLRIVGEQVDKSARGWWQDEHFCLLTTLDRAGIERFFLEKYAPTPFVSPWNRGSGFYGKTDVALGAVESSVGHRFAPFRSGIAAARAPLAAITEADAKVRELKDRTKARTGMSRAEKQSAKALKDDPSFRMELAVAEKRFKELKADLFTPFELSWRGAHRAWMDAAVVGLDDGRVSWPSLLGTGGSDGRFDFTNNVMQRLGDLFILASPEGHARPIAAELLEQSLWSMTSNELATGAAIGQFFPGGIGGANSTTGADGESLINPWDFVLMMEGTVLFSARSTRRLDPAATRRASAPFAVRAHAVGHGTPGREKAERGEQWMPLWVQPTSTGALRAMLGEGRVQLGRQVASRPIDVARAVARLGVARGINSFTRFGYLERNGQSNIAVPLGRVKVRARPRCRLIDDLSMWLDRLQRLARHKHAAARLVAAEGRLADSVLAVLTHDDSADRWQAVLLAAVAMEEVQVSGTGFTAGPIPVLASDWVAASNDGSVEWRLARALGGAAAGYARGPRAIDPVRHHWLPLQSGGRRFQEQEKRLLRDSRVVIGGRDAVADMAALVERRIIEAAQSGHRNLPLVAAPGCDAHSADVAELIGGRVDLARVSALARGFMAVRWNHWQPTQAEVKREGTWPDEAWMALRLACLPWGLDNNRTIPVDHAIVRRLRVGDGAAAIDMALRRLRAAGLRPPLQGACVDPATSRLWAAALAFPISLNSARAMARRFEPNSQKEIR